MAGEGETLEKSNDGRKQAENPELSLVALAVLGGKSKVKPAKDINSFDLPVNELGRPVMEGEPDHVTISYEFANHNKEKTLNTPGQAYTEAESNLHVQESRLFNRLSLPKGEVFPTEVDVKERLNARGLSQTELAHCYHHVSRLLEDTDNQMLGEMERQRLAFDILRLISEPGDLVQGNHATCLSASIEYRALVRDPAAATKLVVDIATTGRTMLKSGQTIVFDDASIKPDQEARFWPPGDRHRSYMSQLFQLGAINGYWQSVKQVPEYGPHYLPNGTTWVGVMMEPVARGSLRYFQHPEFGECLVKTERNTAKSVDLREIDKVDSGAGSIPISQVSTLYSQLLGVSKSDFVITRKGLTEDKSALTFDSESELHDLLCEMQKQNRMPLLASIHAGSGLIRQVLVPQRRLAVRELHAISIASYDAEKKCARMENSWEKYFDCEADLHTLFESMATPLRRKR